MTFDIQFVETSSWNGIRYVIYICVGSEYDIYHETEYMTKQEKAHISMCQNDNINAHIKHTFSRFIDILPPAC